MVKGKDRRPMNDYLLSDDFMRRFAGREKAVFQLLFQHFYRPLCFFAAKIIRDQNEAEDIVQDVFINFWKHEWTTFSNFKTIKTFLYNSVQNRSLNYLRDLGIRERNYKKLNSLEKDDEHFIYHQIRSEVVAEVFAAIDELPERCREIFKMAYLEEHEEKEIASLLKISVNTIKTQKLRAKNYLKERLGELFIFALLLFPSL